LQPFSSSNYNDLGCTSRSCIDCKLFQMGYFVVARFLYWQLDKCIAWFLCSSRASYWDMMYKLYVTVTYQIAPLPMTYADLPSRSFHLFQTIYKFQLLQTNPPVIHKDECWVSVCHKLTTVVAEVSWHSTWDVRRLWQNFSQLRTEFQNKVPLIFEIHKFPSNAMYWISREQPYCQNKLTILTQHQVVTDNTGP